MKKLLSTLLILAHAIMAYSQIDVVGSGRAILFDGVDDYVDLGDIYDNIALPITMSAWIYVEPEEQPIQLPIFDSQDNLSTYNGFTLLTSTLPHVGFSMGDGKGGNNPAYRRARAGYFNTMGSWVYVTAVARSGNDIHTYVNGLEISADYQGTSPYPMNSYSPAEVAKIGYLFGNGIEYWFKGMIDELRIWNRSLSETEIRESMCKRLKGDEPGLIGYWNFDETSGNQLNDLSPNGFHGVLKGNPQRVFSGAPVGDESVLLYTTNWTGKILQMDDVTVTKVSGQPFGVHIYRINHHPTQTIGLWDSGIQLPYYGVFLAADGGNNVFDFQIDEETCSYFGREDNSQAIWSSSETFSQIQNRLEFIRIVQQADLNIELGEDIMICDRTSLWLEPDVSADGRTFLWNTGEATAGITVTQSGRYSVEVSEGCQTVKDSILISFEKSPPDFSLGEDQVSCLIEQQTLTLDFDVEGLSITWQDGSALSSFVVQDFGTFWVKAESECGISIDSITFSEADYFSIELGEDIMICDRTSLWLEPDVSADDRTFLWNTGAETAGITVTQSGRYSVEVSEGCRTVKDSILISFEKSPPDFSLGEDQVSCLIEQQTLTLDFDVKGFALTWQDGSAHSSFLVQDFGTFWVKVESQCGTSIDSITFSKADYSDLKSYNFFSPGTTDDRNQYFVIDERLLGARLSVFNRWGRKVYSSLNYHNDWDGDELPSGVYYYTLTHECIEPFKGTVTLMR